MDESENDTLNDIHDEVRGSNAQLGAIAERTRNIQESLDKISDDVDDNRQEIDKLQGKVKRNTTVINAVTVGLSGLVLWAADKVSKLPFV